MGGSSDHPVEYFAASTLAAILNYPLWRASALGQSGFRVTSQSNFLASSVPPSFAPYLFAFSPPYKGIGATVMGMSWARAAIFYGSDRGKEILESMGVSPTTATLVPPLLVSTGVQIVNMPLVRATISLQNPESNVPNIRESFRQIYKQNGIAGLWHGTSAGVLKTVPKYCTAVLVKEHVAKVMPPVDSQSPTKDREKLVQSAIKSSAAGVAGAALTNPLDVIRNEMFKTNLSFIDACRSLHKELGYGFLFSKRMNECMKFYGSKNSMPREEKTNAARSPPPGASPARKKLGKESKAERREVFEREKAELRRNTDEISSSLKKLIEVLSNGGVSEPYLHGLRNCFPVKVGVDDGTRDESTQPLMDAMNDLVQADNALENSWSIACCYPSIDVNILIATLNDLRSLLCTRASSAYKQAQRKLGDVQSDPKADPTLLDNMVKHEKAANGK